jgi:alpha-D-xyloside xylohydrolase
MVPMHADNLRYYVGNGAAVTNIYPMMHAQAFYEGMLSEGEDEVVLLSRSGWAGIQRYGATIWSGDVPSTFESLQKQIPAGLNMALSGIPYWTTDIGGFYGGNPESPDFRELVIRWFQFGAFCPIFRLHGVREPLTNWTDSGGPNEVWSFGEQAYAIIRELLFMRERLRTYIDKQMDLAHKKGIPPMRPLFYDFPKDSECWKVEDQFMFGPDLLIAPVLHKGARSRDVYLPAGTDWTDAWTGEKFKGGQRISTEAPIDRIPVYLRGKAKLPIRK